MEQRKAEAEKAQYIAAEMATLQQEKRKQDIEMDRTKEVNKRLSIKVGELTADLFEKTIALEKTAEATRSIIADRDRLANEVQALREEKTERETAAKES